MEKSPPPTATIEGNWLISGMGVGGRETKETSWDIKHSSNNSFGEKQENDEGMARVILVILLLLKSANFQNNPRYALLFHVP